MAGSRAATTTEDLPPWEDPAQNTPEARARRARALDERLDRRDRERKQREHAAMFPKGKPAGDLLREHRASRRTAAREGDPLAAAEIERDQARAERDKAQAQLEQSSPPPRDPVTSTSRASGGGDLSGFVLGAIAVAVGVNYLRGTLPDWWHAKLENRTKDGAFL